jgi:hypothetical protein
MKRWRIRWCRREAGLHRVDQEAVSKLARMNGVLMSECPPPLPLPLPHWGQC